MQKVPLAQFVSDTQLNKKMIGTADTYANGTIKGSYIQDSDIIIEMSKISVIK